MTVRMERHFTWLVLWVLLALQAGCKEQPKPQPPPPPKVTVAQPVQQAVTDSLDLTGNTQAIYTVQLVARVVGYLEKVLFQDGQQVKKGQPLFVIQQNTYEDNLRQAEAAVLQYRAQLQWTESQLTRYSNLIQRNAAARSDVENWHFQRDTAAANLRAAEAQRDLAKLNLDYTLVTAPFDGRMDRRLVDPGNLVGSGGNSTVLAQINQIDPIYVYFNISDLDLARLLKVTRGIPGSTDGRKWPVHAGLPNEDGYPHQGYLDFAAINLTTTTGTLLMRGVLPNADGKILPGLYTRVRVPLEQRTALLVPEVAVGHDQQGAYLLVVNDKNVVERRHVTTGAAVESRRVIATGLTGGEWVDRQRRAEGRAGPAGHPRARGCARAGGPSLASGEEDGAVISKFFIEHPIFANVIALVTVIVGGLFLYVLPVAQYPEIVPPTIQVSTRYPGASAEVVAATIGVPLEQAINGVENSIYMSSTSSSDGSYALTITFDVGTDLDTSLALVQNLANSALSQLPGGVTAQGITVRKVSPNILLVASLYSEDDRYDETFFSNYAIINLQNPLARIQGVGQIRIFGAGPYSMRVWLDPKRLQTFGLTTQDVLTRHPGTEHRGGGRPDRRPAGPRGSALPVHDQRPRPALRRPRVRRDHDQVGQRHRPPARAPP